MTKTIVFIHGLFQNPESWQSWMRCFEKQGYVCYAPAYPYHEGNPSDLRKYPDPRLGKLSFGQVIESLSAFIDTLPEKPILIGHSMGGLAVQKLLELNKGVAGVCIDSAPPRGIMSFQWSFVKANFPTINPFRGNSVCLPDVEWFHYAFCHTMTLEQTAIEFEKYVVPESRNIPRSTLGEDGAIEYKKPHKPLLFIAGEQDYIVPASLNRKNFEAYTDADSRKEFKMFQNRTHSICRQDGWEEVAEYTNQWLKRL